MKTIFSTLLLAVIFNPQTLLAQIAIPVPEIVPASHIRQVGWCLYRAQMALLQCQDDCQRRFAGQTEMIHMCENQCDEDYAQDVLDCVSNR